jgi:uncharacterized RDD family membrane protein YckC
MLEDFNPELNNPTSNMTLAGAGSRLVAAIIDYLIVIIPLGILQVMFLGTTFLAVDPDMADDPSGIFSAFVASGYMLFNFFSTAVGWVYFAYFESSEKQATFGKQAMNIKVVTNSGQRLTFPNALGRVVSKILSSLLCCIGYLMILFRADEKGLHDLLANTYVVKS